MEIYVLVAQFVFLFQAHAIFRKTSTEMDIKNYQMLWLKQIDNNFSWFILLLTKKMMSKCSKLCSETTCLRLVVPHVF